jgi:hypothetical protein
MLCLNCGGETGSPYEKFCKKKCEGNYLDEQEGFKAITAITKEIKKGE